MSTSFRHEHDEGRSIQQLVGDATDYLMLAAPFIKVAALRQCLELASKDLQVEVFTRWRAEEIAAGVSDLSVYELLRQRPNATLYLANRLHAKVYRTASRCLVGSANLTARALGWSPSPNLEILVECSTADVRLAAFESTLRTEAIQVDDDLYQTMSLLMESYCKEAPVSIAAEEPEPWPSERSEGAQDAEGTWIPKTRQPEDLVLAYSGQKDELSRQTWQAATSDLEALAIGENLGLEGFTHAVGIALLQTPVVSVVDRLVSEEPKRFGAVVDELHREFGLNREEAVAAWQALMRWLLYFIPGRYQRRVDRHTEMFARCG